MLSVIWKWFVGLFTKEQIGILFRLLFQSGVSTVASYIADVALQQKALECARDLAQRKDISNSAKVVIFNQKMSDFGRKMGKPLCDSVVNCLRELSVNALKAERGK